MIGVEEMDSVGVKLLKRLWHMQVEISSSTRLGPGSLMRSPKCVYWVGGVELRMEL